MSLPLKLYLFSHKINIHLILEYVAFFVAYRFYTALRKKSPDQISSGHRLTIILGAAMGAFLGSRLIGYLENPVAIDINNFIALFNLKTIMGGLFGGLIGVETVKKIVGEKASSGDLFVLPVIMGIFIGRIGCFLAGTDEFTYGRQTSFIFGMNLGDGLMRHPIALYELAFLFFSFFWFKFLLKKNGIIYHDTPANFDLSKWNEQKLSSGTIFKYFMIVYFAFRFLIEFLKPPQFLIAGLSSIQILCLICFGYYYKTILKFLRHAG